MRQQDVGKAIRKFHTMLDFYPDEANAAIKFKKFFRFFLRLEGDDRPLPSLELMTILKEEKPLVYKRLKREGEDDPVLGILTETPFGYDTAEERIHRYLDEH